MRLGVDGDHGIRDVRVDPAEPFDRRGHEPFDLPAVADVGLEREVDGRVVERVARPGADHHAGASPLGALGDRPAEAVGAAADDDHLLGKRLFTGHSAVVFPPPAPPNALP